MKQVFLDLDGVIVDFAQGCIDHFNIDTTPEAFQSWGSIYDFVQPMDIADFWKSLDYNFWFNLKMTPEALVILEMVKKYKPVILTMAAYSSPGVYNAKADWIKEHLPEYFNSGRYLIGGTKHQIAERSKLLIDDSQANCEDWSANGGHAILVPRPWNKDRGKSVYNAVRHGLNLFERGEL